MTYKNPDQNKLAISFLIWGPLNRFQHSRLNMSFPVSGLSGDNFRFDLNGDGPARYNIIHYKQVKLGQYQWVTVGSFQDDKIQLNMEGKDLFKGWANSGLFFVYCCLFAQKI